MSRQSFFDLNRTDQPLDAGQFALENATQEFGRELLAGIRAERRKLSSLRKNFSDKLMDWAMSDPGFKVQLFRFVDVFPALSSPQQVHDLLLDYLQQPGVTMPSGLDWGLKAGGIMKGTMAKTVASNISRMAETFIAGRSAEDALPKLKKQWKHGVAFSVDLLGEACLSDAEAERYRSHYLTMIRTLAREVATWPDHPTLDSDYLGPIPRANVSIKISALAAQLKPHAFQSTIDQLLDNIRPILLEAARSNVLVNFDMEQSELKDLTLALFQRCCEQIDFPAGLAMQAYLKSGPDDARQIIGWAQQLGRQVTVRLIKGAYWDYEVIHAEQLGWPIPVWTRKADTDACFEAMIRQFVSAMPKSPDKGGVKLALGSHNARSIAHARAALLRADLPDSAVEFQLLEGMADALREVLVRQGQRVRTYVPLGEMIPGMAYLVRRLLENTSNESWLRGSVQASDERLLASPATVLAERSRQPTVDQSVRRKPTGRDISFQNEPPRDFADSAQRTSFAAAVDAAQLPDRQRDRSREELGLAIATAAGAFSTWAERPVHQRSECLRRAARRMREQRDALAAHIILEAGKPWREADADVCEAIDFCEYYANQAEQLFAGQRLGAFVGESNDLCYHGIGVAGVISPWNFPLAICTGMTVAALVSGNPVLVKPAEQSTTIAAKLCELLWDSGVPREVLHYVPGPGETIGAAIVQDPRVSLIAFTGSREVGLQILESAGRLHTGQAEIKRVICEMGGKNAIIVDQTADLDEAVAGVCHSAFGYAGQKCSACSRVILVGSHAETFTQRLVEMTRALVVGDPRDPATDVGPLIDEAAAAKVRRYIELGQSTSRLRLALNPSEEVAARLDKPLVGPHIFSDVSPDDALAREEIFGPVLAVVTAESFEHALEIANSSVYKLTGAVYSRTPANLERAKRAFRVGNLYLNRGSTGALVGRQAFGGFGHSGTGTKAGGPDYLRHFVHPTLICENNLRRGFAPGLES